MIYDKARSLNQELTFTYADNYFVRKKVSFEEENMRTLGLIDGDGFYTNTGLLLSDQCEHSIKCAIFNGEGKTTFKTRKEFYGSILQQLEESYEYISTYNNVRADFLGLDRIESYDYPEYAVREALLNSIVHRDYNYSGSIIINIFTDRMEFVSIGGLVQGITLTDAIRGVSQSRNMAIANIFYRLKLIESYGTGLTRNLESYENFEQPQFLPAETSFVTVLPNTTWNKSKDKSSVLEIEESRSPEERVLDLLKLKKEITRKDVEELLKCSGFPARQVLNQLLEKKKITVYGNARSTKYKLLEEN